MFGKKKKKKRPEGKRASEKVSTAVFENFFDRLRELNSSIAHAKK